MTSQEILTDPSTRNLVKEVAALAGTRDPVDAYYDVRLALEIIKERMDKILGQ